MNYMEWAERFFSEGQSIEYAQVRPMPLPYVRPRRWWHNLDCSGSPPAQRIITFMEWYDGRRGMA